MPQPRIFGDVNARVARPSHFQACGKVSQSGSQESPLIQCATLRYGVTWGHPVMLELRLFRVLGDVLLEQFTAVEPVDDDPASERFDRRPRAGDPADDGAVVLRGLQPPAAVADDGMTKGSRASPRL